MNYFISKENKIKQAQKISKFLLDFKNKLNNSTFRTTHNLNRWKIYKNKYNKILSSLGYKLNLETKELRELIPMKIKVIDYKKQALIEAREHLEMTRRKYNNIKSELVKAKNEYSILLENYTKENI